MQQFLAMSLVLCVVMASLWSTMAATPVEKVIKLLTDLKAEVEEEGKQEAQNYEKFACFCKKTTESKSDNIKTGRENINQNSADIEQKTALKETESSDLTARQGNEDKLTKQLADVTATCEQEAADYQASAADLAKAIKSLESAIKALNDSVPTTLLALKSSIQGSLDLAEALNLLPSNKQQAITAFLQQGAGVDPVDPTYKYHSHGIISTLEELLTDFRGQKADLDAEWTKTEATCSKTKQALQDELTENKQAMDALEAEILQLKVDIATARKNLVQAEATLKDDQLYLQDLTARCEKRANEWDQRAQLRKDELEALAGALAILENDVSGLDAAVNKRVLLQERRQKPRALPAAAATSSEEVKQANSSKPLSFVQGVVETQVHSHGFLARAQAGASAQARQEAAASLLRDEAHRLRSTSLATLASQLAADPFAKVKTLIQKLIERLLKEATDEATKKGFCDEELGKAKNDREARLQDVKKLHVELGGHEAKRDELEAEIAQLSESLENLKTVLATETTNRDAEKALNAKTLKDAKEGLGAITEAIDILKVFYKRAARAKVLLQASPVDEDLDAQDARAGFEGAYRGKQEASKGVIGMLEVIKTDFDRTIRITEEAEAMSHADFVAFERATKADISGKEEKKQLNEEDLATTNHAIKQTTEDLTTAMNLLDSALKVIEGLKPTCIDTGMSYADRVAKREEEIQALKRALCILAPDDPDKKKELCE
mmetsp:Transcript_37530/g.104344  ORF Transcript_37530/g.104344 Transcript_37530/m.104344 type:complete len:725 (-) Transcript_37530:100-2274(-)